MRQYLSAVDVANEIRMRRIRWPHAFVVVEGDSDARFYRRFVFVSQDDSDGLILAHGREKVLGILAQFDDDAQFVDQVVGIADRDFWVLGEGCPPERANLLFTDGRDLESMVLRSPALSRLLDGYGSPDKLTAAKKNGRPAIDTLLAAGCVLGLLRWLNERARATEAEASDPLTRDGAPLRLDFNQLDFNKWVDRKTLDIDQAKLLQALAHRSQQTLDEDRIQQATAALREHAASCGYGAWDICCGHDLIELLKISLRSLFGSCSKQKVEGIERVLLMSIYHQADFAQTNLYASMQQWQANQPRVRLLPEPHTDLPESPSAPS